MVSDTSFGQPPKPECTIATMNRTKLVSLSMILVVGGVGWWLHTGPPGSTQQDEKEPQVQTPARGTNDRVSPSSIDAARQRIEDASSALQSIIAQRKSAEMAMQEAERQVEELERFIEDIEARGEDPADYANEGLARFQPAFYAYQDAFDKLELAETMERAAAEELAEAEDQLARVLAP